MNKQGRRRKTEGGISSRPSRCAHLSFPLPPSSFRLGTTLIELLITITIIAILSATFLGVSNVAMESAREARTKTTIGKINGLLMEKWNSYANRRVDIEHHKITASTKRIRGQLMAWARLDATRQMMQLEMPDRWSDILRISVSTKHPDATNTTKPIVSMTRFFQMGSDEYLDMRLPYPAISSAFLRRYNSIPFANLPGTTQEKVDRIQANQGAECLYMIIMLSTGDGEARTLFSEQDIGDVDEDGAPEFIDGWGRPIEWMRWPVGFVSDIMPVDPVTGNRLFDADHDPFDHFRLDEDAFRITPLIYSSGADGISDLAAVTNAVINARDPYATAGNSGAYLGTARDNPSNPDGDDNSLDNIHNHLQDNK